MEADIPTEDEARALSRSSRRLLGNGLPAVAHNTVYLYPYANVIPRDVLSALPAGRAASASVLLLGCGDWRHLYFSLHARFGSHDAPPPPPQPSSTARTAPPRSDRETRVKFVAVDVEPAILARNLMLARLFLDATAQPLELAAAASSSARVVLEEAAACLRKLWCLFYCQFVDAAVLACVRETASALHRESASPEAWAASPLGAVVRVSPSSLPGIRDLWSRYATWAAPPDYAARRTAFLKSHEASHGIGPSALFMPRNATVNPMRSATIWSEYSAAMHRHMASGVLDPRPLLLGADPDYEGTAASALSANPLFALTAASGDAPTVHYAAFPPDAFHPDLADRTSLKEDAALDRLYPRALLRKRAGSRGGKLGGGEYLDDAVASCLMQLADWALAFRRNAWRVRIDVITGDAIDVGSVAAVPNSSDTRPPLPTVLRYLVTLTATSQAARALLETGNAPTIARGASAHEITITVEANESGKSGSGRIEVTLAMPVAVRTSTARVLFSRKRQVIELRLEPALSPLGVDPDLPPLFAEGLPSVRLARLPPLNPLKSAPWLYTLCGSAFSAPERLGRSAGHTLVELKDSIHSIAMTAIGENPDCPVADFARTHMVTLQTAELGVVAVFVINNILLDVTHSSVVFDVCASVLTMANMTALGGCINELLQRHKGLLMHVKATPAEVVMWKRLLVAAAERCAEDAHSPDCEHAAKARAEGGAPPSVAGYTPLSLSVGEPVFCRCRIGKNLPPSLSALLSSNLGRAAQPHFVRAALPLLFGHGDMPGPIAAPAKRPTPAPARARASPAAAPAPSSPSVVSHSCGACGKPEGRKRCGACRVEFYCDKACQLAAWRAGHKARCKPA